jgi:putative redox protein
MAEEQVEVAVQLTNQKVRFKGTTRALPEVTFDYAPPVGDGQGYTGLEMLLMSLAACSGTSVVFLLRKMGKDVSSFGVQARGIRRETHPTSFKNIVLQFTLNSKDAQEADLQKAIRMSEESYCPVWAMIKGNVEVSIEIKL